MADWRCRKDDDTCTRTRPCRSCLGRRARRAGMRKQVAARHALGVPDSKFSPMMGSEEGWILDSIRWEVKSGKQVASVANRFLAAEAQAPAVMGDARPFGLVVMPTGMSDGFVVFRISDLAAVADAYHARNTTFTPPAPRHVE